MSSDKFKILKWPLVFLAGWLMGQLFAFPPGFMSTDFSAWGEDWSRFLCVIDGKTGCAPLSKFPISYLLNSSFSYLVAGAPESWPIATITLLFLVIAVAFTHGAQRAPRSSASAFAFLAAIVFSSIPAFYVNSGALEVQFGIVLGIFGSSVYRLLSGDNRRVLYFSLFVSSLLLPLYKDVSISLMAVTYAIAVLAVAPRMSVAAVSGVIRNSWKPTLTAAIGVGLAVALSMNYNWMRYQSIFPVTYLIEAREARPPFAVGLNYLFWIFLSPNGGLVIAWTASLAALLSILYLSGRKPNRFGVVFSVAIVCIYAMILSNWWTPFGWTGWGNRLIIPALIASIVVLSATSDSARAASPSLGYRHGSLIGIGAVLVAVSFVYISYAYSLKRYDYLNQSMMGSDSCKAVDQLQDIRSMWEFKKSELQLNCHLDRFKYIPGTEVNVNTLFLVGKGKHELHNGNTAGILGEGWSGVEDWGVWSDANAATIRFIPTFRPREISLGLQPFTHDSISHQRLKITFEGKTLFDGSIEKPEVISLQIPKDANYSPDKIFRINLELPDAVSPLSLGLNADTRLLGVGLRYIDLK